MATDPDPPQPPAMSWERRVSRPPLLNDQTAAMPIWVRPFAKPQTEYLMAAQPKLVVIAKVAAPYVLVVTAVANTLYGVPMRHMLFSIPATTLIGILLMVMSAAGAALVGRLSGYRPASVSWTLDEEHTGELLANTLTRAALHRGFIVVWSKDHMFVATRNVERVSRSLTAGSLEDGPRRLSLLNRHKKDARVRTMKVETHGACVWDTGEAQHLESLAHSIVQDAAAHAPWIAQSARWSR